MNWEETESHLSKTFTFKNFIEAFSWMTAVAIEVEKLNHHPEWQNVYNSVEVKLSTHDAGNVVTEKDRALAKKMDQHFSRFV